MKYRYSERMKNLSADDMRGLFRTYQEKTDINLFTGNPSDDVIPRDEMAAILAGYLKKGGTEALQYGTGYGNASLRVRLAAYLKGYLQIGGSNDSILITEGASQATHAILNVFCNPGDAVICDQLTSPFLLMMLKNLGIEAIPVEMDNEGMSPERLEAILSNNRAVKLIYLSPDFQVPTGVSIPESRRRRLIAVAERYGCAIIEDASNSQIRLYNEDIPSMKSMDETGAVIHLGSFSQLLSPGLRVGYVVAEEDILQRIAAYNLIHSSEASPLMEMVCSEYLKNPERLSMQIDRICEKYRSRYEQMTAQLQTLFPEDISFTVPDGGLYLWCTDITEQIHASRLARRLHEKYGIRIAPGSLFSVEGNEYNHSFALNYTIYEGEVLTDILNKIAFELREMMPGYNS